MKVSKDQNQKQKYQMDSDSLDALQNLNMEFWPALTFISKIRLLEIDS